MIFAVTTVVTLGVNAGALLASTWIVNMKSVGALPVGSSGSIGHGPFPASTPSNEQFGAILNPPGMACVAFLQVAW
jgi:hypothetical protein